MTRPVTADRTKAKNMKTKNLKTGDKVADSTIYIIGDANIPQAGRLTQIGPAGQIVRLCMMRSTGERMAIMNDHGYPVSLLGLAAGKDAWMRGIAVRCVDCRKRQPACEMECELCAACYEKAEQENAVLDGKA